MFNKLILILVNCLLFTISLTRLNENLSFPITIFLIISMGYLSIFRLLKSFKSVFTISIAAADLIITKFLYQRYYLPTYEPHQDLHHALILIITISVFSFISKETLKQIDGKLSSFIHSQVLTFLSVFKYYFYFKLTHKNVDQSMTISFQEFDRLCFYFFIDFLVLNFATILALLLKIVSSFRNKQAYLQRLITEYLKAIAVVLIYNLLNNMTLMSYVYQKMNEHLPQPYNVLLYNTIPSGADERFNLLLTCVFSYFN